MNRLLSLFFAVTLLTISCRIENDRDKKITTIQAYSLIDKAVEYRTRICRSRPSYDLYIPKNPPEQPTRLCALMIVRGTCPFHEYPMVCYGMYGLKIPFIHEGDMSQ